MSIQFDTFDTKDDRRELVILFQKLGEGLPESMAREVRAAWLQALIPQSVSGLATAPLKVNPDSCHPVGAYTLFVQIVGVLGVPIKQASVQLDRFVKRKSWNKNDRRALVWNS
jgi:hypothetical protein